MALSTMMIHDLIYRDTEWSADQYDTMGTRELLTEKTKGIKITKRRIRERVIETTQKPQAFKGKRHRRKSEEDTAIRGGLTQ